MSGFRMWVFEYDSRAAERGFEMEKFHFSQEDWREYEKDYGYQEDTEPPTERVNDRRSSGATYDSNSTGDDEERVGYDWIDELNREIETTDIDVDVVLGDT